ncbi:MAG TPA: acetyl-CoA C-acyltransferase [Chloroflexi bacterium]|nr:acetyl-CoA C-acyltransferase [Chloroflexota bacterium]
MREAVIVSAMRSPTGRGRADGALASVHPIDLAATVMRAAVDRAGIEPEAIEDVLWGCAFPEAGQGLNIARLALLRAGMPVETTGATINRFCSSGLQTIAMGAQSIMTGMADVVLAGGVEMMSQVPMSGYHARLNPEITKDYIGMGFTAERVAERWGITRNQQDEYAYHSQRKAAEAWQRDAFADELVTIPAPRYIWHGVEREIEDVPVRRDETMRPDTTLEGLAKLRPAFKATGAVTAGNASPFSDGSAAVVLMSREDAEVRGLEVLARFVGFATAGVDPDIMGIGPSKAVPKLLGRLGMTLDDIDLIEFNEAFAAQVLAVTHDLELQPEKINVNGGAIALGHPLGATGAKLTTSLIHELRRRGGGTGLVTMCVGGGMGAAAILEVYGAGA